MTSTRPAAAYRPDIDGLRAVAVLAVVLYHCQLGAPGGYVGVDVFFVISGYLITSILRGELSGNGPSLANFWERRVRRIFPALALVTLASLVAGWFLLLPADYKELAQSVCSQSVFGSNFFFWIQTNYWDGAAETKPLLHTWSLAVEEQFYLLYPFLLLGLSRLRRSVAATVFAAFCVASLALSVDCVLHHPRVGFYLLPFRAWELGLGGAIAFVPARIWNSWIREIFGGLGLLLIGWAIFTYDATTPFPGVAALLPCGGAALLISFDGSACGRLLSCRPLVFIGLVSYSFYLWHWPLLAFAKYWAFETFALPVRILLAASALLFAFLSWKYIETPFRRRSIFAGRRRVFIFFVSSTTALLAVGGALAHFQGAPWRMPAGVLRFSDGRFDFSPAYRRELTLEEIKKNEFVAVGSPNPRDPIGVFVWGDSHAMAVLPAIDALGRAKGFRAFAATHSETPPLVEYVPGGGYSLLGDAPEAARQIVSFVRDERIPNVLLVARWKGYSAGQSAEFHTALEKTLASLTAAQAKIWIMKEAPNFPWNVPRALARAALFRQNPESIGITASEYAAQLSDQEREFQVAVKMGARLLDPSSQLVKNGFVPTSENGFPLYRDVHHLTTHGALLLEPLFEQVFR